MLSLGRFFFSLKDSSQGISVLRGELNIRKIAFDFHQLFVVDRESANLLNKVLFVFDLFARLLFLFNLLLDWSIGRFLRSFFGLCLFLFIFFTHFYIEKISFK